MILTPYLLEQFVFSRALCEKKCSVTPDPAWGSQVRGGPEEVTRWIIPCVSNIKTNYSWSCRMFRLIVRFSKYDFWNPGEILNWYRWNIFFENIFSRPKKITKKMLKICSDFFWKNKFLKKHQHFENFEISKFWKSSKMLKFSKFRFF